jgi:methyl coenzyme M reductase subunit C
VSSAPTIAKSPAGGALTVRTTLPDFPSVAAVIVAEPGETPVTTPVGPIDATLIADDVHVSVRSVTRLPSRSRTVVLSCT